MAAHDLLYGFELELEPELVVVRCVAIGVTPSPTVQAAAPAAAPGRSRGRRRRPPLYWDGEWIDRRPSTPGNAWGRAIGSPVPAVIEQEDSTTLVHPGHRPPRVDPYLNLILRREDA